LREGKKIMREPCHYETKKNKVLKGVEKRKRGVFGGVRKTYSTVNISEREGPRRERGEKLEG